MILVLLYYYLYSSSPRQQQQYITKYTHCCWSLGDTLEIVTTSTQRQRIQAFNIKCGFRRSVTWMIRVELRDSCDGVDGFFRFFFPFFFRLTVTDYCGACQVISKPTKPTSTNHRFTHFWSSCSGCSTAAPSARPVAWDLRQRWEEKYTRRG